MAEAPDPSHQPRKKQSQYNSYLKYSGLAVQLLGAIFVCGWIGSRIDRWLEMKLPLFMIVLGLLGFAGVMYQVYRSINRP
jgi:F0F1-type ATP synthase assembly protein I